MPNGRETPPAGGSYETADGAIKKLDDIERVVVLTDGRRIPIDDIYEIESDLLRPLL